MADFFTDDTADAAEQAAKGLKQIVQATRQRAAFFITRCDAGSLNINDVLGWLSDLGRYKVSWAAHAAVSGVGVAVQTLYGVADGAAAITAGGSAIQTMITFLESADGIPTDASNRAQTIIVAKDGNGTISGRLITNGASLATFKTNLQSLRDDMSGN